MSGKIRATASGLRPSTLRGSLPGEEALPGESLSRSTLREATLSTGYFTRRAPLSSRAIMHLLPLGSVTANVVCELRTPNPSISDAQDDISKWAEVSSSRQKVRLHSPASAGAHGCYAGRNGIWLRFVCSIGRIFGISSRLGEDSWRNSTARRDESRPNSLG